MPLSITMTDGEGIVVLKPISLSVRLNAPSHGHRLGSHGRDYVPDSWAPEFKE